MTLYKQDAGFIIECDECKQGAVCSTAIDYKSAYAEAKEQHGYIARQINGDWFHFCCDACYQKKRAELTGTMKTTSDILPPVEETLAAIKAECDAKKDFFKEELEFISEKNRALAESLFIELPDYFFEEPASSTGKYHPSYTNGKGGLVRHTKAAMRIAIELLRLEMYQSIAPYQDYILIALMLHDGWKHGLLKEDGSYNPYTKAEHPAVCAEWLMAQTDLADVETLKLIADMILTHMGQWNMSYRSGAVFAPKPTTMLQCFVHLCDYLASRKCLEFNFEVPFGV